MTHDAAAGVRLVLEGALTIGTAETVRATLRAAIERPPDGVATDIAIDCSAAGDIDLTFVQLLIATRISADLLGKTVRLAGSPDGALLNTLTRGGFRIVPDRSSAGHDPAETDGFWFEGANA